MSLRRLCLLPCLVWAACFPAAPAPRVLVIEDVQPRNAEGVYLNEELVFAFSAELDPATVTEDSVRVLDPEGRQALGERIVQGRTLRFRPKPVLAASLDDGGYRPDTSYAVELAGFPRLDGLRGVQGQPLERSYRRTFQTVSVAEPRVGFVFDDATPGSPQALRISDAVPGSGRAPGRVLRLSPSRSLYLSAAEPLDPSTLHAEDFHLVGPQDPAGSSPGERVELVARFLENRDAGTVGAGGTCALIELIPRENLEPGVYTLRIDPALRLRDFGGNPVWRRAGPAGGTQVVVDHAFVGERRGETHLTFLDDHRLSPVAVPGGDGTAWWGDGRLEVHLPAAVGSGVDGAVRLAAVEPRHDVRATRLTQEAGERCELAPGPGLRVLRSQGRVELRGTLVREVSGGVPALPVRKLDLGRGRRLSEWLESTAQGDVPWTVVIAGGDLVIEGELLVDTPLLLVAGGYLRIQGKVRAADDQLWLQGRGGGMDLRNARRAAFRVDSPEENILAAPLRFLAVSSPLPAEGGPVRWLEARAGGRAGPIGGYRVRYQLGSEPISWESAVAHPRLLDGAGPIRALIELRIEGAPAESPSGYPRSAPWDPPYLDFIHLIWER